MDGRKVGKNVQQHAFSLVELMVVISIVATLAAVSVPSYREHLLRAKVSSLISITDAAKTDVVLNISMGTVYGATTSTLIASGASPKPAYLNQLVRDNYGCLSIQYDLTQLGLDSSGGKKLTLMLCPTLNATSNLLTWNCGYSSDTTAAYTVYLPASCKQAVTQDTTL